MSGDMAKMTGPGGILRPAMIRLLLTIGAAVLALAAGRAEAQEAFGGVSLHGLGIVAENGIERGADFVAGWRGGALLPMVGGPRPYLLVSINGAGGTDFAAAGIGWKFGTGLYMRPGIGIAVQNGDVHPSAAFPQNHRIPFGSPILFEPELGIGARIGPKMSLEASWIHLSHAYLFGSNNPGLDSVGLRLNIALR
jgi:lipid A 3-O-deacylase